MYYHYTIAVFLAPILREGQINPSPGALPEQRPTVWATRKSDWEGTANKAVRMDGKRTEMTKDETEFVGRGLYRIEINPRALPLDWASWVPASGIDDDYARHLRAEAERRGSNVSDWRMSFDPIPTSEWLSIEKYENGRWQPVDLGPGQLDDDDYIKRYWGAWEEDRRRSQVGPSQGKTTERSSPRKAL
jgi:hypothetical protein